MSSTGHAALPPVLGPEAATGTGDNMAAALGLGLRPGDVAISLGTSGTVFAVSETPTADPTGAVCGFADATGRYLPLVCTLNATKVTDATAHLLGVDLPELDDMALSVPAGSRRHRVRSVPRRRAHAEPARRDRDHLGAALRRRPRAGGP